MRDGEVSGVVSVLLYIVCFVLGFLAASVYYNREEQRKRISWERQMQEMQKKLNQAQSSQRRTGSTRAETLPAMPAQPRSVERQPTPEKRAALPVRTEPNRQNSREQSSESFQPKGTLQLQFRYSFPDQLYFTQGQGYVYNGRGELMPQPKAFEQANTAVGYAQSGMFYVFDAVYRGEEYHFQQILDGAMGSRYLRVCRCLLPARISPGNSGCYVLAKKGKLEVEDLQ